MRASGVSKERQNESFPDQNETKQGQTVSFYKTKLGQTISFSKTKHQNITRLSAKMKFRPSFDKAETTQNKTWVTSGLLVQERNRNALFSRDGHLDCFSRYCADSENPKWKRDSTIMETPKKIAKANSAKANTDMAVSFILKK